MNAQLEGCLQSGFRICWVKKSETRDDVTPEQAAKRRGKALYSQAVAKTEIERLNAEYPQIDHFMVWDTVEFMKERGEI